MEDKIPYSAEHPVAPENFAGRAEQIKEFERFLDNTINGNSKNVAVLGEWGIGKTSLLRMFKHIAEQNNCTGTIIELGEATDSFLTLFETITQNLAKDSQTKRGLSTKTKEFLSGLSLSASYGPIGLDFSKRKEIPPNTVKFKEDLIRIYQGLKCPFLIMLDNAEQLLNIKGSIFELRNIFQMLQSMDEVRCMLILAGRETLFSEMRSVSEPAVRFFWGIELKQFTYEETKEAIEKPLVKSKIKFDEECIQRVHEISQGHPYFVQVFAYNLYLLRKGNKITLSTLNSNFNSILNFFGKRLFDSLLSIITPRERAVVLAFTKFKKEVVTNTELANVVDVKSINQYLIRLSEIKFPIVIRLERGRYKLFHPLFKEYLNTMK